MTKEFLKNLGLDENQINEIMKERGKELARIEDYDIIKEKYSTAVSDLTKLQEEEPNKIAEEIKKVSKQHKEELTNLKLQQQQLLKKMAIKSNLTDAYDSDIILGLIDLEKIEVDQGGNIKMGLIEQIENLKKEKSFLFKQDEIKPNGTVPATNEKNTQDERNSFVESFMRGAGIDPENK